MFQELLRTYQYSDLRIIGPAVALLLIPLLLILLARGWLVRRLAPGAARCPRCGSATVPVHRRPLDRALSLLVPVRRFRCQSRACGWNGLSSRFDDVGRGLVLKRATFAVVAFIVVDALMIMFGVLFAWFMSIF